MSRAIRLFPAALAGCVLLGAPKSFAPPAAPVNRVTVEIAGLGTAEVARVEVVAFPDWMIGVTTNLPGGFSPWYELGFGAAPAPRPMVMQRPMPAGASAWKTWWHDQSTKQVTLSFRTETTVVFSVVVQNAALTNLEFVSSVSNLPVERATLTFTDTVFQP